MIRLQPITDPAPMNALFNVTLVIYLLAGCGRSVAQEIVPTSANLPATDDEAAQVEKIVRIANNLGPKASTPAQLVQLTREMKDSAAAQVFLRVATNFLRQGKIDVAADVVSHLLRQYPKEPATTEAGLLLVQLYSSGEVAHSQSTARGTNKLESKELLTYSAHLTRQLLQRNPSLSESAEFAFQCAVIARQSGRSTETKSWLTFARHQKELPHWRQRALAETWLIDQSRDEPPLSILACVRTAQPPHLDGQLNDDCWQANLAHRDEQLRDVPLLLCDSEYLYLAARCEKQQGLNYQPDERSRTYDAGLSGQDRLEISLDVDRDYASCYRLTVDHRGWTNDACWLDQSWNPRWYVASEQDESAWTFEAAIPWSELVSSPPRANNYWAVGLRRKATNDDPAAFHLLRFE